MRAMMFAAVVALGAGGAFQQDQINDLREKLDGKEAFRTLKVRELVVVDPCGEARVTIGASERHAVVAIGVKDGPKASLFADQYAASVLFYPKGADQLAAHGMGTHADKDGFIQVAHNAHTSTSYNLGGALDTVSRAAGLVRKQE